MKRYHAAMEGAKVVPADMEYQIRTLCRPDVYVQIVPAEGRWLPLRTKSVTCEDCKAAITAIILGSDWHPNGIELYPLEDSAFEKGRPISELGEAVTVWHRVHET